MSHYTCLVLIPNDTLPDQVEDAVEALLEPYSENRETEPYETKCYCVNHEAQMSVGEEYRTRIDALRKKFHEENPLPPGAQHIFDLTEEQDEEYKLKWQAAIAPLVAWEKEKVAAHPMFQKPQASCEDCQGTGIRTSEANPEGYWDWWVIGGRWDGMLPGKRNMVPTPDVLKHWDDSDGTYSMVTPDGQWHARGKMGWFGMSNDNDSLAEWRARQRQIMADYPETFAVVCDLHT